MSQRLTSHLTILVAIGVMIVASGATLYFKNMADAMQIANPTGAVRPLTVVDVTVVEMSDQPIRFQSRGILEGIQETRVSAEVEGRVITKPVRENQTVSPGDVLCQIDPTFHQLNVRAAEAQLAEADATCSNAQAELQRVQRLEADHTTELEHNRVQTARDRALEAKNLAAVNLAQARERLERCRIVSPIHGRVAQVFYELGELLTPMSPVVEIVNLDQMKLVVELPDFEAAQLSTDAAVTLSATSLPNETFGGSIRTIYPKANPLNGRVPIEIVVGNPHGRLRSGTFVTAVIEQPTPASKLLVPTKAVHHEFGVEYCYVAEPDGDSVRVGRRTIVTAPVPGSVTRLEVRDGLAVGDLLITSSQHQIAPGEEVTVRGAVTPGAPSMAHHAAKTSD